MSLRSPSVSASSSSTKVPTSAYIAGKQAQIEKLTTSICSGNLQTSQRQLETIQQSLQKKVPQVDWLRVSLSPANKLTETTKLAVKKCLTSLQAARLSLEAQAKGYLFLHYAVLENKPAVVAKLLELGADPSLTDPQGLSAIDHAALQKNPRILSLLVLHQIKQGKPLQTGTVDVAKLMTPGIDPKVKGRIQRVLLAQMGALAEKKDPLQLSKTQKVLFMMTCLSAVIPLLASSEWMPEQARALLTTLTNETLKVLQWEHLFSNTDLSAVKGLITWALGQAASSYFPALNMAFQAFLTGSLAHSTIQAMRNSYNHIRYRTWDSICYVGAHAINLGGSCFSVYKQAQTYLSSFSASSEKPASFESPKKPDSPLAQEKTVTNPSPVITSKSKCNETTLDIIIGLRPSHPAEAMKIISDEPFDLKDLKAKYAERRLQVHPDKCPQTSGIQDKANKAFRHLVEAEATLKEQNKYPHSAPLPPREEFFTVEQQQRFTEVKRNLLEKKALVSELLKRRTELDSLQQQSYVATTLLPPKCGRDHFTKCYPQTEWEWIAKEKYKVETELDEARNAKFALIQEKDAFIRMRCRYRPENPADLELAKKYLTREEMETISKAEESFQQERKLILQQSRLIEKRSQCGSDSKKEAELTQEIDRLDKERKELAEEFHEERAYYWAHKDMPPAPEETKPWFFSQFFS